MKQATEGITDSIFGEHLSPRWDVHKQNSVKEGNHDSADSIRLKYWK